MIGRCLLLAASGTYCQAPPSDDSADPSPDIAKISLLNPVGPSNNLGFTLIELIVVVALIAVMLFFSFPKLSGFLSSDGRDEISRWIIVQAISLRTRAVETQKPHLMVVDLDENKLMAMPETMDAESDMSGEEDLDTMRDSEALEKEADATVTCQVPDDMQLLDVAFPGGEVVRTGSGIIHFYPKGYTDRAVIHLLDGDDRVSYYFAPFLAEVKIFDGYWMFE
ncbi:MAG: prepilin-type N-terminal cleavage/methylation domain-containing protein [Thermodesulfobacteriota bacterium]|nr:prepilin-type N-terminal cleavage/methylation domain-containing protein [Thermodesulfobacteriota bacterium]